MDISREMRSYAVPRRRVRHLQARYERFPQASEEEAINLLVVDGEGDVHRLTGLALLRTEAASRQDGFELQIGARRQPRQERSRHQDRWCPVH
jgi:hypothetical protein